MEQGTDISDVSVVICTRNNKKTIRQAVQRIINEKPGEIIVVDGNSTDGTREILKKMPVRLMTDPGKGLALARQTALDAAAGRYILFAGDDNILPGGGIAKLKSYMLARGWAGGAFQTRVYGSSKSYWAYCADWRFRTRVWEGERKVVGTPYMFETEILKQAGYDEACTDCDDSDIAERISVITGRKYGYTNLKCLEIGKTGLRETIKRFLIYGRSDAQYWKKYAPGWGISRKMQSLLHPLRDELIESMKKVTPKSLRLYVFPYFLFITVIRYLGWVWECVRQTADIRQNGRHAQH